MSTLLLQPIYVGEIVVQPFSFAATMQNLVGLTITNAELTINENASCIESVRAFTFTPIDGVPGADWEIKGLSVGYVAGDVWLTLSDGERVAIPWQLEVRAP